jgi:cell migration-inducing and hyaluronan-binding protein
MDSLFVGESANIGNPTTPAEKAYGRSLPEPALADFPIRGYEFYDYRHELDNVTFVNFQDNATRKTGALSYLLYTSFSASNNNNVQHAKFINAKPVYFPPINPKWGNDNDGSWGFKGAVFHDVDGSVTGVKDSTILNNDDYNGIAIDKTCEIKATWNAAVCTGDGGRLTIDGGHISGGAQGGSRNRDRNKPPVTLSRDGKTVVMANNEVNIHAGTEIKVTTDRPTLDLHLTELDKGSWVLFELPGFASASGKAEDSLDAVRKSDVTAYYKDGDALWVKVVSNGEGARIAGPDAGGTELEASRPDAKVASR